ncbi:ABC transporter substrate-binding protein [soil metagenome]
MGRLERVRGSRFPFRHLALAIAVLLVAILFAAPHRDTKESALRKYPNRVPVRFWHMWSAEWKDVVDKIVARYNESQDKYEVIALSVPGGGDTKFLLGAMGGDPPDVMAQWNAVIPTWAGSGMLEPYENIMTPEEKARFEREAYPVVKRIGQYQGKTYGIPIGLNVSGVYYLPDALKEAGIEEFPKTWEDLVAASAKLTKRDKNGNLVRLGLLPGGWNAMAGLFGGGFYDFKHDSLTLDDPKNLACLQSLVDLRKRDGYEDVQRFQSGLNTQSAAGGWPFIAGAYAMAFDGAWRVEQLGKYAPHLKYEVAPMPAPQGGNPGAGMSNGNFMIIPRSAKEKAGAWDFVKFWSGLDHPERAAEFYVWGGWLPFSEGVAQAPIYQAYIRKYPQFGKFVNIMRSPDLVALPPVPTQVFITDQAAKVEDLAIRGTITPQQAVHDLQAAEKKEETRRKELGYDE